MSVRRGVFPDALVDAFAYAFTGDFTGAVEGAQRDQQHRQADEVGRQPPTGQSDARATGSGALRRSAKVCADKPPSA